MKTYTFAAQTTFHGAPVTLVGKGDDEAAAIRDALSVAIDNVDYRHRGSHFTRTMEPGELFSLVQSDSILGGKGGWVAVYRFLGDHEQTLWVHRGGMVEDNYAID